VAVNENLRKAIEQEQKLVVVGTSRTFRRKEDIFVDLEIVSDSGLGLYLAAAWTYCFVLTDLYLTDPFKAYAIFLSNPIVVGLTCDYILAMPPNLIGFRRMFGSVFFCAFSSFVCLFILSLKLIVEFWRHRYVWAYRLAPSLRVWRYLAAPFVLLLTCAGRDCARRRDRDDWGGVAASCDPIIGPPPMEHGARHNVDFDDIRGDGAGSGGCVMGCVVSRVSVAI
jgi:hypothetical protein